jgi:hypothetical protein
METMGAMWMVTINALMFVFVPTVWWLLVRVDDFFFAWCNGFAPFCANEKKNCWKKVYLIQEWLLRNLIVKLQVLIRKFQLLTNLKFLKFWSKRGV